MTRHAEPTVLLDARQVEDLADLLSSLEGWLRNARYDTIDDLAEYFGWHDERAVLVPLFVRDLADQVVILRLTVKEARA
jgi:hypothetical protein